MSPRFLALSRPSVALLTSTFFFSTQTSGPARAQQRINPLLEWKALPKFNEIQSTDIQPALVLTLESVQKDFNQLEKKLIDNNTKKSNTHYSDVIEELERIQAPLSFTWGVVGHLMGVKNSDELRKAHQLMQPAVVRFNQELGQNQVLYQTLVALKANSETWNALDEAQHRIVNSSLRDMKKSGVGLSIPERAVFNQFQLEVSELGTKFSNNVLDSTKAFKLNLTSVADVEGLPASAKALLAQQAASGGFPEVPIGTPPHSLSHLIS
jgi:oligopeptidase A